MPDGAGLGADGVGFTKAFVSHAGGARRRYIPAVARLGNDGVSGPSVSDFLGRNIAKFIPYACLGMFTLETAKAKSCCGSRPLRWPGGWIGVARTGLFRARVFQRLLYVLLTVTGVKLIWEG